MHTKADITEFLSQKMIAVVGASRDRKKFGNSVVRNLLSKGYDVYPVNPNNSEIEHRHCYHNLMELPRQVENAIFVVPPQITETEVRNAKNVGITRIWMQQGAESMEAVSYCETNGISVIAGECILMFAEPAGFGHLLHRRLRGAFGKLPT